VKNSLSLEPAHFTTKDTHQLGYGSHDALNVHRLIKEAQRPHHKEGQNNQDGGTAKNDCRIHGSFVVNKVMGNLHITALGHGYAGIHVPHNAINFTHRVDKLSFGLDYPGLVNPLDNSFEIANENFQQFQYFISIVPTIYIDSSGNILLTSQYAVTDYKRTLNDRSGGNLPGIFIKYDIEAISVRITETRKPFLQFLVRLCGIVGGIFAAAGMFHQLTGSVVRRTKQAMSDKPKSLLDRGF